MNQTIRAKLKRLHYVGQFSEHEAVLKGMRLIVGQEGFLRLYWLVDPTDGVIADAKFQAFGPPFLIAAGEIVSELVLRKNHAQASRISADLIDQHVRDKKQSPAFPKSAYLWLNQAIQAIDGAVAQCQDIPCTSSDYDETPIAWDIEAIPGGIPGWDAFPEEKKIHLIEEVISREIRPYIELDAGGIQVLGLRDNGEVRIAYEGACTTCHSSTGSTLSAIQQILQARIHPTLVVIPEL